MAAFERFYNPYVGENFVRGSLDRPGGLLILSESAYGWEEGGGGLPDADHPLNNTVGLWALSDRFDNPGKKARYVVWLTRALCRKKNPTQEERAVAWSNIAYSIYVQRRMESLSERPTLSDFENSGDAFLKIIEDLRPSKVLITSISSWCNMPFTQMDHPTDRTGKYGAYMLSDQSLVWCLGVPHQRARRMGWERLAQCIADFCQEELPVR
jgi:hypothetical protein